MKKRKLAIIIGYWLAIAFLTACAILIVVKLIFWPPCTQTGNNCVIDGWTVAGLAGTVLGVAATVLAILGAVSVAAWWTSLNDQVTGQVIGLWGTAILPTVNKLLGEVEQQVPELRKQVVDLEKLIEQARSDIGELKLQMVENFLDYIDYWLPDTEKKQKEIKNGLTKLISDKKKLSDDKVSSQEFFQIYMQWLMQEADYNQRISNIITYWKNAEQWLAAAKNGQQTSSYQSLSKKVNDHKPKIERLKKESESIKTKKQELGIPMSGDILRYIISSTFGDLLSKMVITKEPSPEQPPPTGHEDIKKP